MILAAQGLGLGTLWICDVFYSNNEIYSWLNPKDKQPMSSQSRRHTPHDDIIATYRHLEPYY
ncbi:hypothetical protein Amet_1546 [Alkaliphilus metalliredigens QYMF]|uniref:Nitroreductase n=2 Tax=Alkaliphilus TaxID=114627 RepID=A6TNG4_ALKMQ|nr:hypothetical protein Amet_1546 [Alkaliphilus metalliredigens QYMF]